MARLVGKTAIVTGAASGVYCSAKAGVLGLTRSMATTYAPDGVRTNAICLGSVDTPRLRAILQAMPAAGMAHDRRSPLQRPGRPEEIASIALFLSSEDASYVNGHTIVADGGSHLVCDPGTGNWGAGRTRNGSRWCGSVTDMYQ